MRFFPVLLSALHLAAGMPTGSSACTGDNIPKVEGPIVGGERGHPFAAYFGNINDIGYIEEEFFISGIATRYEPVEALTKDGHWTLKTTTNAEYKTRILVHRPRDHRRFNGVAIIEWINVSFGYDMTFGGDAPGLYEDGTIYILASVQRVGIVGYDQPNPQGLQQWDNKRYGSLHTPDDAVSYDIFTQVARLAKSRKGQDRVLGGLRPNLVVGAGGSQSGSRVLAYTNGVQPLANTFDVLLPMLSASNAASFFINGSQVASGQAAPTTITQVRTDLSIPVWMIHSELEAFYTVLLNTRQPDTPKFRYWEVAGASHVNVPLWDSLTPKFERDDVTPPPQAIANASRVNWLPVVDAAYRFLPDWAHHNRQPPSIPPTEYHINGTTPVLTRGADGNVIGGVRLPELTVPIAAYVGLVGTGLTGSTTPYDEQTLKKLYPTHQDYVSKVIDASRNAQKAGIILDYQVALEDKNAGAAHVP